MPSFKRRYGHTLSGVMLVALFGMAALRIADLPFIKHLRLSPLIIGILIGMLYANTLRRHLPREWVPGVVFCAKYILRLAIVLFGFRITFQDVAHVGWLGSSVALCVLATTLMLGIFLGEKVFKLDRHTAILVSSGSAVCGAAAVLATESVIKADAYKSAVAVATVVIFGTLSMFLYPLAYRLGWIHLTPEHYGIYVGSSVHEVAQVVGGAGAVGLVAVKEAVIVKMLRVMMLAPLMILFGLWNPQAHAVTQTKTRVRLLSIFPWFALFFIVVVGFHSFQLLPAPFVHGIDVFDTFLLTMAMVALGIETDSQKLRRAGVRPLLLGAVLFLWLFLFGYGLTYFVFSL